jgi:hypothetical protein
LTEIYLYHACSYGEIEDGNGPDRGNGDFRIYVGPAPKFANQASSASAAAEQRAFEGGQSQEARVRELDAARVLVSQGKGDSAMMPPGTWGMRLPLTATRLCVAWLPPTPAVSWYTVARASRPYRWRGSHRRRPPCRSLGWLTQAWLVVLGGRLGQPGLSGFLTEIYLCHACSC